MSGVRGAVFAVAVLAGAAVACSSSGGGGSSVSIKSATYAENCGAPTDVSKAVQAACSSTPCSCDKTCFSSGNDPAYGCGKGLEITYEVGGTEHTVTCAPVGGEGYVFTIAADGTGSCSAPASSSSSSSGGSKGCTSDSQCSSHCSSGCYECHSGSCSCGYEGSDGCVF